MSDDNFALEEPKPEGTDNPTQFLQEEFPQVDPFQVEKELTEKFVDMQKDMPAEDVAAHFFQMYYPIYKQLLSGLSNKDARRVAEHVVQWPLEDENPKFHSTTAKQAFSVGTRLIDCKMIMKSFVEMERHKEMMEQRAKAEEEAALKASEQTTTEETPVVENKGEEASGKDTV